MGWTSTLVGWGQAIDGVIEGNRGAEYKRVAEHLYHDSMYYEAIAYYESLFREREDITPKIKYHLAECYRHERLYEKAAELYHEVSRHHFNQYSMSLLHLGKMKQALGHYREALEEYKRFFRRYQGNASDTLQWAFNYKNACKYALEQSHHPDPYIRVQVLDENVNKVYSNYSACLVNNHLWYTGTIARSKEREIELPAGKGRYRQTHLKRIFRSRQKSNGQFDSRSQVQKNDSKNKFRDISSPSLVSDGNKVYYTMRKAEEKPWLYWSPIRPDTTIGVAHRLHFDSPKAFFSVKHPDVVLMGGKKILFFAANVEHKRNDFDIYAGLIKQPARITEIHNLGDQINTPENEISPYYDAKNLVLYFASEGHQGMGGYDIHKSRGVPYKNWKASQNPGVPVNSGADETFYIRTPENPHQLAFFCSNRVNDSAPVPSTLYDKIYQVVPVPRTFVITGRIFDSLNGSPVQATVSLVDQSSNELIRQTKTNEKGKFQMETAFDSQRDYGVEVRSQGYMFVNKNLDIRVRRSETDSGTSRELTGETALSISLKDIEVGENIILSGIHFGYDTASLRSTAYPKLDRLILFMQNHPEITVQVAGHTDSTGTQEYNQRLSRRRAENVVDYLVEGGIDPERLRAQGYGSAQPVAPNTTAEGRRKNRRVECTIIAVDESNM